MSNSANWKKQRVQLRRGTAAEWAARNTLLLPGELGYETDTDSLKIGDGVTRWNQLSYWGAGGVAQNDPRLTDAREWSEETISQAEAEAGSATTRRAFTAQRVFQAIAAWWNGTTDKQKLDGIASGATANSSDAHLLARQNHTGTQAISTVTDLQEALNAKAPINNPTFTGTVSGITKTMVGLGNVDNTSDADKPISTATQTALDGKQAAGSYATLVDGTVPTSQLPGFVDDVLEYANVGDLPGTGAAGVLYVVTAENRVYRWSGTQYIEIVGSPGTTDAVAEGTTNLYYTDARASAAAPVQSVAGRTGTVVLGASDIASGTLDIARIPTGTTSTTVCIGDDARLSDARAPTAHKASHATSGSDALAPSDIGAAPAASPTFTGTVTVPGLTSTGVILADDAATANSVVYSFDGDPNSGIGRGGADIVTVVTAGSERLRVDSSGRVGIGGDLSVALSSPLELKFGNALHGNAGVPVANPTASIARVTTGTDNWAGLQIGNTSADGRNWIFANQNGIRFDTSASGTSVERMRIKPTGAIRFVPLAAAPATGETGDVYYNSANNKLWVYDGSSWVDLHSGGGGLTGYGARLLFG